MKILESSGAIDPELHNYKNILELESERQILSRPIETKIFRLPNVHVTRISDFVVQI